MFGFCRAGAGVIVGGERQLGRGALERGHTHGVGGGRRGRLRERGQQLLRRGGNQREFLRLVGGNERGEGRRAAHFRQFRQTRGDFVRIRQRRRERPHVVDGRLRCVVQRDQ